ncbi:energy-coupling factor ABC transporter ATP-binding protein [Sinanaerobacter sp. ZZT-01]|uniref:ABC transporter ATP-binding protein n=1 Tax=Sinanaerobacter sp. ZZT-01 TaxID=3111540 RepID=UPI002D796B2D|nr:energy-coupling factor ABC transporter ATP-binding protein [Sinanaerobacter sp. ZZT-01]WRR94949.1 energy-coupling factor ABC transporter ATP-binding protein [Sinanaerobacter sp. ZZT-01]
MIQFKDVSFIYHSTEREDGVHHLNFSIPSGQVVVLCGQSGCGKTTVTRLINGLVPEYYEGTLQGEVLLDRRSISKTPIYQLSRWVGSVFQNPSSQFFNVDTTGEIAFGCENTGISKKEIYQRIGKVATELNIWDLLGRSLFALSGGEKQKIACASVSAMLPEILVLDEPSSNLDVSTIGDLKYMIAQWKKQGRTIIIAEHRLYYLMELADRIIYMKGGKIERDMTTAEFKALPLDKLRSMGLRSLHPVDFTKVEKASFGKDRLTLKNFSFYYGKTLATNIPLLEIPRGAIVGVLGNNGAGKSTFAKCLCGLEKSARGILEMEGKIYSSKQRIRAGYMVMQDVNHQLFTESVLDEILLSMPGENELEEKKIAEKLLESLNLSQYTKLHPMSLSGGQKQRVAIGSAIVSNKEIIVFDEPTSGLDYKNMLEVAHNLEQLSALGKTLLIITHDPELLAQCCNYFMFIDNGQIAWSGGWNEQNEIYISKFFAPAI